MNDPKYDVGHKPDIQISQKKKTDVATRATLNFSCENQQRHADCLVGNQEFLKTSAYA